MEPVLASARFQIATDRVLLMFQIDGEVSSLTLVIPSAYPGARAQ